MQTLIIGYQGAPYSNSYRAAMTGFPNYIEDNDILLPLVDSATVADNLESGAIDYGVVAIINSLGGVVEETEEILDTGVFEIISETSIQIHHCLFKHPDVEWNEVDTIASHIQALIQTYNTRLAMYPGLEEEEIEDTAIGAIWLADGTLPKTTAVLCPLDAGLEHGLDLVHENLEDTVSFTTFGLIRVADAAGDVY